jgi:hypothetical protein
MVSFVRDPQEYQRPALGASLSRQVPAGCAETRCSGAGRLPSRLRPDLLPAGGTGLPAKPFGQPTPARPTRAGAFRFRRVLALRAASLARGLFLELRSARFALRAAVALDLHAQTRSKPACRRFALHPNLLVALRARCSGPSRPRPGPKGLPCPLGNHGQGFHPLDPQ